MAMGMRKIDRMCLPKTGMDCTATVRVKDTTTRMGTHTRMNLAVLDTARRNAVLFHTVR